jgi:hypothetical protein
MNQTPLAVDDVSVEGFRTTIVFLECMLWGVQCQATKARKQRGQAPLRLHDAWLDETGQEEGLAPLIICLWPTACGFLPSKVLDCIIVPESHEEK